MRGSSESPPPSVGVPKSRLEMVVQVCGEGCDNTWRHSAATANNHSGIEPDGTGTKTHSRREGALQRIVEQYSFFLGVCHVTISRTNRRADG